MAALESNERVAMKIFRQVVLECAHATFPATATPAVRKLKLHQPRPVVYEGERAAS
jgi:hypothetical protein